MYNKNEPYEYQECCAFYIFPLTFKVLVSVDEVWPI